MSKFADKVAADNARERQRRKDEQKQIFKEKYSNVKKHEFPDAKKINMVTHFNFPKMIGKVSLSTAAMAVYPVLCVHADFEKSDHWFQLSRDNMAAMAGVSPVCADKAMKEFCQITIENEPLLQRKKMEKGSRRFYVYQVGFIRKPMMKEWQGQYFPFYRCLIDSGVWANLKPRAKALYLVLRQCAQFDFYLYCMVEDLDIEVNEFEWKSEGYRERKWEVVATHSLAELCRLVGIERSNIRSALAQLERHRLINRVDDYFMVYLKTQKVENPEGRPTKN